MLISFLACEPYFSNIIRKEYDISLIPVTSLCFLPLAFCSIADWLLFADIAHQAFQFLICSWSTYNSSIIVLFTQGYHHHITLIWSLYGNGLIFCSWFESSLLRFGFGWSVVCYATMFPSVFIFSSLSFCSSTVNHLPPVLKHGFHYKKRWE